MPTKNSSAGTSRVPPPLLRSSTPASLATSAAGTSAVGNACATLPQSVPRLRICVVETAASAAATSGQLRPIAGSCSTRACVTMAPIRALPFVSSSRSSSMPRSPINASAWTSPSRIMMSSDCPPARTFAESPCSESSPSASSTVVGAS